jgi:hypothetical protein
VDAPFSSTGRKHGVDRRAGKDRNRSADRKNGKFKKVLDRSRKEWYFQRLPSEYTDGQTEYLP